MQLTYTVVSAPHNRTVYGVLNRTPDSKFYWAENEHLPSTHAVLAEISGKLVGIQKFDINGKTLYSGATFVWPLYRREGVALGMWGKTLTSLEIEQAFVGVVSDKGKTLVESLIVRFPNVKFVMGEAADRRLRSLKPKGKAA